ncbi:hypothetical protein AGABI1DRAFT_126143 [Agaricus bisporus var. burnettii JB137-S8]|uniref:F-box domain-containing protein n=1 Tax=Agaricus bisporus var. burnettii (strain JB137-S8 / ATCC MYA-4627 / FGSC 10392) TaxID=597362 RepID=K5X1U5_AGABU|nr:uncharacterized protein AGABI1DRAFT_126143 [Agaricus bisporus var. burnettii JB137-S8]EKM81786.1 hypothetical protein AGABI1DRAFT_126143 [Agaricus bisporus var. burnettii JB137-S8]
METFQLFNDFPADVQRLIFEYAFYSNPTALQLALVSREVNGWIEPLIYKTIIASRRAGRSRKSPDFYESHVRFIVIDDVQEDDFIKDLLSKCHDNLIGLAFWPVMHNRQMWASLLLATPFPSLRQLSISSGSFSSDSGCIFRTPIFQNLTHLEIRYTLARSILGNMADVHNTSHSRERFSWVGLQSLKNLNHLHVDATFALNNRDHDKLQSIVSDIISHLPPRLVYVSICLPTALLREVAQPEDHQRPFYDDLISGRIDARIVVCYSPTGNTFLQPLLTKAEFFKYLLPRRPNDRVFKGDSVNDFWKEVENVTRRRNTEV